MTKRFEKAKFGTVIKDNSKQDTLWTATECIDRMNELAEEYERLKSSDTITDLETEIMNLKTIIDQLRTDNTKQKKKLNITMKEKGQLKQRNQELFDDLQNKTSWLSLRGGELAILKRENEHLKQQLELYQELYPSGKWICDLNSDELQKEL